MSIKRTEIRVDAREKLNGEAKYIRDEQVENLIYGTTVRSTIANGLIKDIIFDKSFDWSKITIVTYKDVYFNHVSFLETDMPFLAEKEVKYLGESILLLASEDRELLKTAKEKIKIIYEELPAIFDLSESENSPVKIYKDNNVIKEIKINKGSIETAKKEAKNIVKIVAETGFQEHLYVSQIAA